MASRLFSEALEVLKWRELILGLAIKDLKNKYRYAAGGFGWMFLIPLAQMVVFSFIFGYLFKIKIENYAFFLLVGLFPWSFLRSSLDSAVNSILSNSALIRKTAFRREALPMASVITNFINFLVALFLLFVLSLFYGKAVFTVLFWVPLVVAIQVLLLFGMSLALAGLNAVYRETQFILEILLLVWFYFTPVVYSFDMVQNALPCALRLVYDLNPMAGIIVSYQQIFLYGQSPNLGLLMNSAVFSILIFLFGWIVFSNCEKKFTDMI